MKFKKYDDFINEWRIEGHGARRASISNKESRTAPYSKNQRHGWKVALLARLVKNNDNSLTEMMKLDQFLDLTKMSMAEFEEKVSKTLEMLVNSTKARSTNYDPKEKIHRFVHLGKIAFQIGNELLAPRFLNLIDAENKKGLQNYVPKAAVGSRVWCDVKENKMITFFFLPDSYDDDEILSKPMTIRNRMYGYSGMDPAKYKELIELVYLRDKKSIIKILDSPDWEQLVKQQIEHDTEI